MAGPEENPSTLAMLPDTGPRPTIAGVGENTQLGANYRQQIDPKGPRPYSSAPELISVVNRAKSAADALDAQFRSLTQGRLVDDTGGVYRIWSEGEPTGKKITGPDGEKVPEMTAPGWVNSPELTDLARARDAALADFHTAYADGVKAKLFSDNIGPVAGNVRTYLDLENDKTSEVTRQLKDFLTRAKGVYDLQDANQAFAMRAEDQNMQHEKMVQDSHGMYNPSMGLWFGPDRPGLPGRNTDYAGMLAQSTPEMVLPDYQLNGAVGLPGQEGFNSDLMPGAGLPRRNMYGDIMEGYAQGTPTLPAGPGVPEELAWMIGMPAVIVGTPPPGQLGPDQVYAQLGIRGGR